MNIDTSIDFRQTPLGPLVSDIEADSIALWAAYVYLASDSEVSALTPMARRAYILATLGKSFEEYEHLIDTLASRVLSRERYLLYLWEKRLFEREQFLATVPYSAETYDMIEDMLSKTHALWKQYREIVKMLDGETEKTLGDREESLIEKGL